MIVHPIGMMRANAAVSGFEDTFSYSNGTTLVSLDDYDSVEASTSGVLTVQSGAVTMANYESQSVKYIGDYTVPSDFSVEIELSVVPTADTAYPYVYGRYANINNWWRAIVFVVGGQPKVRIQKKVGGTLTANVASADITLTAGDVFALECVGNTARVLQNGTQRIAAQTDAGLSGTIVGLGILGGAPAAIKGEITRFKVGPV